MISTQYIKLNMVPNGIPPVLYCSQYDIGRPLGLVVYNGSDVVDLSTYTATIEATRTDRTPITAAVTTDGNIGVFNTTATMTNKLDRYGAKLVLSDSNGNRVASLVFFMVITLKTMDENAEGIQEDQSLYQQYTATVQTIIAQIRSDLVAEANARQAADQTLQQNINAEASARQSADNTLQSNINAEASTRATQDASLQSQIDQLVAPSGEAPSAAEVENARIGSDGTVYPTLGDAIRTQNSLLKSHLGAIADILDAPLDISRSGQSVGSLSDQRISGGITLKNGETYEYGVTIPTARELPFYIHLRQNGTDINSLTLDAGAVSNSKTFTATQDYTDVSIDISDVNRGTAYSVYLESTDRTNIIDVLNGDINDIRNVVDKVSDVVELPVNLEVSGSTIATTQGIKIAENIHIRSGHTYTYDITLSTASDQPVYVHLWNESDTSINSLSLNAGQTYKSKVYTATADVVASLVIYDVNRALDYTVTIKDNDQSSDAISRINNDIADISALIGTYTDIVFTDGKYINTPSVGTRNVSTEMSTLNACSCFAVSCQRGDIFVLSGMPNDNSGTRPYMWLNSENTVIYRSDETTQFDNVEVVAPYDGTLVVNMLKAQPHSAYKGITNIENHVINNIGDIKTLVKSPLETLPDYVKNDMAYRPLGQFQKPYLCLSCDDGSAELETYTIPMLLQKNVPCTFGLWATKSLLGESPSYSESVVLRTESGINAVLSAIQNGCAVAQHGTVEWTDMTEEQLNDFFTREQEAFTALGITVKGAICPSHCVNNQVRAIAGGWFGVVRSGYKGYKSKADQQNHIPGDVFDGYTFSCSGNRSNIFSLTSFNTNDKTLNELKQALDYAISQNMLLVVYWHDWDLTSAQKANLEAFIDYAKTTTVTFCTLGDIPTLV